MYCTWTNEQATPYDAVVQGEMLQIEEAEGMNRRGLMLSMLMQLKQICSHPMQYLHRAVKNGGEALHLEMDEAIHKTHKSCQHVYSR
ncbi:MAG: hypothetical protein ACXW4M_11550 [Anaerolineales bacterium]